jgi:hypothetical protein
VRHYEAEVAVSDDGTVDITVHHENETITTTVQRLDNGKVHVKAVRNSGDDESSRTNKRPMFNNVEGALKVSLDLLGRTVLQKYLADFPDALPQADAEAVAAG